MSRRRYQFTEAKVRKYIAEGRGSGDGASYKPWLTVYDLPSRGRSHRPFGIKTGRTHHLLSDGEWKSFIRFEYDATVLDIREQFPLDRHQTMRVARDLVGDFYQHTYDTSRDGSVNKNLHASYGAYLERLRREELRIDTTSLRRSYRCSEAVCEFIRTNMGIEMHSASERVAKVVWIDDVVDARKVHGCNKTVKLFYQEHHRYGLNEFDFQRVKEVFHDGVVPAVTLAGCCRLASRSSNCC
jgi:hypothetical protein